MAATNTVILYGVIVALFALALGSLIIWSRREFRMRLLGVGLSVATGIVVWLAFSQLPGKPDGMEVTVFRENYRCTTIIPIEVKQNAPIYLLARKEHAREYEYLVIEWNMRLANSLQKSARAKKLNGSGGSIIYAAASCGDDEEGGKGGGKGKGKKGKGKGNQGRPGNGRPGDGQDRPGGQGLGSPGQEQNGPDGFTFYPDPVPPTPEKNYGPLYEGPLVMPERQ